MPAVSVIMPAYNVERYLEEAANSALAQTWTDLELVICNDGSRDGTARIAERVRQRDPARVKVVTRRNGGLPAARNTAIEAAEGDFLALLDSDDAWDPTFLEAQMALFAAWPDVDLITTNARYVGGHRDGRPVLPFPYRGRELTLQEILTNEEAVFVMTVMRHSVYEAVGRFDESLRTNEDYDYWIRAAAAGFRFARNPEPLARYRKRDDSLSASEVRMVAGILKVYDKSRRLFPPGSPERDLLEAQITRFQFELEQAHARLALACGDRAGAARAIEALNALKPSAKHRVAAFLARHAGALLSTLYHAKRIGGRFIAASGDPS